MNNAGNCSEEWINVLHNKNGIWEIYGYRNSSGVFALLLPVGNEFVNVKFICYVINNKELTISSRTLISARILNCLFTFLQSTQYKFYTYPNNRFTFSRYQL